MKNIAIIYDLDDTILPTKSIPASTFQPVFDALKNANNGVLSNTILQNAFDDLWRRPMDVVATEYGFSEMMITAGRNALLHSDYELSITPFDDFEHIKDINCKRFLVTTGITKLQQAKINALFGNDDFDEIIIDDPYLENRLGKKNIFSDIANRHRLAANEVWIIGDNPESEIAAGNALGMKTVQILRPEIVRTDQSSYVIHSFSELKALIEAEYQY